MRLPVTRYLIAKLIMSYWWPLAWVSRTGVNVTAPSTTRSQLPTIASSLFAIVVCAAALPFALGYLYAWTWVLPYTSVCKSSLLESDFTAEEFHVYLLNHGCAVDDDIRRYVLDWYATLDKELIGGPKPPATPPGQVQAAAARAILSFHGKAAGPQSVTDAALAGAVKSHLSQFHSFHFSDQDCEPEVYCARQSFWGNDVVSRLFAWVGDKYISFAGPLLLTAIDLGAIQVASVWEQGPLLRGGLLIVYTLATGVLATALFEFLKWRLKKN